MHLVDRHINSIDWSGKKLLVACSGGVDSVVLVHALHSNKVKFAVLHVNYQLRGHDSDLDEQFVIDLCNRLDIPFRAVKCPKDLLKGEGINLQRAARDFRRKLFQQWNELDKDHRVVLAHHQDDQEETFFLQHFRGSGTFGLRGMENESAQIVRPFLQLSKSELKDYAEQHAISWREDLSNASSGYLRNLFRNELLPKLHAQIPTLTPSIAFFQQKLDESIQNERDLSREWLVKIVSDQFIPTEEWKSANEIRQLLLVKALNLPGWSLKRLNELFGLNLSAEFSCGDYWFYKGTKGVYIRPKQAVVKAWEYKIEKRKPGEPCNENENLLCSADIDLSKLELRPLRKDDKISLPGMSGQKKAWDLLKEAGVPSQIRSEQQVLILENQVIWIPGIAISAFSFTKNGNSSTRIISLIEKVK